MLLYLKPYFVEGFSKANPSPTVGVFAGFYDPDIVVGFGYVGMSVAKVLLKICHLSVLQRSHMKRNGQVVENILSNRLVVHRHVIKQSLFVCNLIIILKSI